MTLKDEIKPDTINQEMPQAASFEPGSELDEVERNSIKVVARVIMTEGEGNIDRINQLKAEGLKIQNKFKTWILQKICKHYKVKIPFLFFDSQSPWMTADRKQIFFKVIDTKTDTSFIVIGDLNESGNITAYRVGLEPPIDSL